MTSAPASATAIRAATADDAPVVLTLLKDAALPTVGVPADLAHFFVAERGGSVVGTIGLEHYGTAALLRSAAVAAQARGTGVGEQLVRALLAHARDTEVRTLVLLTTTAESWFPRFGFAPISRAEVPASLHASAEFRGACPESASVMQLAL